MFESERVVVAGNHQLDFQHSHLDLTALTPKHGETAETQTLSVVLQTCLPPQQKKTQKTKRSRATRLDSAAGRSPERMPDKQIPETQPYQFQGQRANLFAGKIKIRGVDEIKRGINKEAEKKTSDYQEDQSGVIEIPKLPLLCFSKCDFLSFSFFLCSMTAAPRLSAGYYCGFFRLFFFPPWE